MTEVWCQTSDVRCLMTDVWWQMSDNRCLMSDVWWQMVYVGCLMSYLWWQMSDVRRLMCDKCMIPDVRRLVSDTSMMSHARHQTFDTIDMYIWHYTSDVWLSHEIPDIRCLTYEIRYMTSHIRCWISFQESLISDIRRLLPEDKHLI